MPRNIETSVFHKGEYVGYADGVWRITKINSACGRWQAVRGNKIIFAKSLGEMSAKLEEMEHANPKRDPS